LSAATPATEIDANDVVKESPEVGPVIAIVGRVVSGPVLVGGGGVGDVGGGVGSVGGGVGCVGGGVVVVALRMTVRKSPADWLPAASYDRTVM
jgi:hypothetical protein